MGPKHTDALNSSQIFPMTNTTSFFFFFHFCFFSLSKSCGIFVGYVTFDNLHYISWNFKRLRTKFLHFRPIVLNLPCPDY